MGKEFEASCVKDELHPSHVTRTVAATTFDVICVLCGERDIVGGGWGKLKYQCEGKFKMSKIEIGPNFFPEESQTREFRLNRRSDAPFTKTLNDYAAECHAANQHWWHDPATGEKLNRDKGNLLMLIVSEIAECMEGERKGLMDDHLPHRKMAEVEMADAIIRIFDYCGAYGFDIQGAYEEKRAYNATRADHKPEARLAPNGKKW